MSSQFFLKTNKDIELFQGYSDFNECNHTSKESQVISSVVSPCGRFLALSTKEAVQVFCGKNFEILLLEAKITDVYDIKFSPSGNFLNTWERPLATDPEHKNVKIWFLNKEIPDASNVKPVYDYKFKSQSNWSLQYSKLDNFAMKLFTKDLRIVKLSTNEPNFDFNKPFATLNLDQDPTDQNRKFTTYLVSPSEHPTICTFMPEKSGKPAQLTIWPILEGKIIKKIATKSFFKADSCQLKWNSQGNAILCLAITDFDSQNKSYYGENTLYLLSFQGVNGTLGGNSVRVPLANGPVHDFTWSPTSRQFGVIAGYMPATVAFFDMRGNIVHSLDNQSKNTMLFSPSGNYILIGGFGNLQGAVEILDRHNKFKSIAKFNATNTSVCMWSPGGEFIMTATTSPRLRVDNAVKVWHVSGNLVFVKEFKELLKVDWRSPIKVKTYANSHVAKEMTIDQDTETASLDPKLNKSQLTVHKSVAEFAAAHPQQAANHSSSNGGKGSTSKPAGAYKPPHARRAGGSNSSSVPGMTRTVPGMANKQTVGATTKTTSRRRKAKSPENDVGSPNNSVPSSSSSEASPEEKKMRSLLKKLRSIETLKQRQTNGDKLEDTQVLKISTEAKVLADLKALGWNESDA
ncbi:similar to Saccharomyces cerevisiae YGR054W Eukaryotic initiation factor (eIF) 2A [Maudiozyma saulgeensis]|uniref:Eukaryotic translation initiation factor 2A n=1 Tax=Maudiozyma saulgeensis TaxID=1789683 RepID=A0A1X7RAM0_9SACH|nr:similar to Saccharomyces cerevisiae YGR054W Eukaryotic initiation factor (eIF) 2A [Kazachstania saulgeensis]